MFTTEQRRPAKIGIADNVVNRLNSVQTGNFIKLIAARHWWLAGRPLALRAEARALEKLADRRLIGEWVDCPSADAVGVVQATLRELFLPFVTESELRNAEDRLDEGGLAHLHHRIDFDFEARRYVVS